MLLAAFLNRRASWFLKLLTAPIILPIQNWRNKKWVDIGFKNNQLAGGLCQGLSALHQPPVKWQSGLGWCWQHLLVYHPRLAQQEVNIGKSTGCSRFIILWGISFTSSASRLAEWVLSWCWHYLLIYHPKLDSLSVSVIVFILVELDKYRNWDEQACLPKTGATRSQ